MKRVLYLSPELELEPDIMVNLLLEVVTDAVSLIRWWSRTLNYAVVKVDLDTKRRHSVTTIQSRLRRAQRTLVWIVAEESPSGRGWHLWLGVWPAPQSAVETVAVQAILGSDPLREAYNLNRAQQVDQKKVPDWWQGQWNVFYRKAVAG